MLTPVVVLGAALMGWYFYHVSYRVETKNIWDTCSYYYDFNDRFGVIAPPPKLQEKRFDVDRLLNSIPRREKPPTDLNKYKIGGSTTGIHEKWNTDNVQLGDMCNWMIHCLQYYLNETTDENSKSLCLRIVDDFVERYDKAMAGRFKGIPWGNNWYEFSISSTMMLFHYIVVATDASKRNRAIVLILRIIETPKLSLGYERNQANSIYLALPWIVAHYFLGDHEKAAETADYRYVVQYIKFPMVEKRKTEGLYLDSTYITHTNCVAYGYLSEMTTMSLPIVAFDNLMRNFMLDWQRCKRILAHPTLPYGPIGFYTRSSRMDSFVNSDSPLGVRIIPTCLFIRMYGDDYAFACRGQNEWIAYYESDKTYDDMSQYWVLYRGVAFAGTEYKPKFPDVGFVFPKYTDSTLRTLVQSRCKIPTCTQTTTTFLPQQLKHKPLKFGFAFAYNNIGIMRHFFDCERMRYVRKDDVDHGRFSADELIICDYTKHTIDTYLRIEKSYAYDMILVADKQWEWDASKAAICIFHMKWDCKQRSLTSDIQYLSDATGMIEAKYPKGITVVNSDNTVILLQDGHPKIAMYPDEWNDLGTRFKTTYNDKELEFVYERGTNQYWLSGLCIDK